jgi:hypothetical protein
MIQEVVYMEYDTDEGPTADVFDIDPPLAPGEFEINTDFDLDLTPPDLSRLPTKPMDPITLNDLCSWCRGDG